MFPADGLSFDQLRYNEGLERLYKAMLFLNGFDWEWFIAQVEKNGVPAVSNSKDKENLIGLAKVAKAFKPHWEYLNKRGDEMHQQAKNSNLN